VPIAIYNPSYPEVMTAVYRLRNADAVLLYVGVAYDFDVRFRTHSNQKEWWPEVASKDIIWFDNRLDAMYEESRAIRTEAPLYNEREGIDPVSLVVFRERTGGREVDVDRPKLIVSDFEFEPAYRKVMEGRAHALVVWEGEPKGVLVPAAWYHRVCELVGAPAGP
jgi:predicted GIY-YIG superfamily endonuclease